MSKFLNSLLASLVVAGSFSGVEALAKKDSGNGNDGCQIGDIPGHHDKGQSNEHKIDYMTKPQWEKFLLDNGYVGEQMSNNEGSNGWITYHIYENGHQIEVVHVRFKPTPIYDVIVRYVDEEGNEIHDPHVVPGIEEGSEFNVSDKDNEIVIDGYEYVETRGETSGVVDGDKEIIVVYHQLENYSVTINYLDAETERPIAESYLSELIREGERYNISDLDDEKVIDGFTFSHVEGDEPTGVMDENKVINVFFDRISKEPEEELKLFDLTVRYVDIDGNELRPSIFEDDIFKDGEEVELDYVEDIEGYVYLTGGNVIGQVYEDVEIVVIYNKIPEPELNVYEVIIEYIDAETGKPLGEPFMEGVVEGGNYDVSHLDDEVEFEGYEFLSVSGDVIGENVDSDVHIVVLYEKVVEQEPEVDPEPTPEPTPEPEQPEVEPQPEPEKPQEPEVEPQPKPQQPEQPKAEIEFDVPKTGLESSLYFSIATTLASAGFVVRTKKERK